jgi:hypothetical protein
MLIPRIPCQDGGAFRSSLNLTCSASPCRAGDSGQCRKPRSGGAERASLDGMALVRPAWPKQARLALLLTTRARAFCPSSIRCRRHCA